MNFPLLEIGNEFTFKSVQHTIHISMYQIIDNTIGNYFSSYSLEQRNSQIFLVLKILFVAYCHQDQHNDRKTEYQ